MSTSATDRPTVPRWLLIGWAIVAAAFLVLRRVDVAGDPGVSNIISLFVVLSALLGTFAWFLLSKRFSVRRKLAGLVCVAVALGVMLALFRIGLGGDLGLRFEPRFGGPDTDPAVPIAEASGAVRLPRAAATDFPGFLGASRDNRVVGVALETDLEANPPQLLWRQGIGAGLAGFAVVGGYAATLEHRGEEELATLYDARTGALLWATVLDRGPLFGGGVIGSGPRTTPLIDDGRVFAHSVQGKIFALDGSDGSVLWSRDLLSDYPVGEEELATTYPYGRSNSPVVVGDVLLVAPGGLPGRSLSSIAALDKATGATLWEAGSHQISMATPQVATLAGLDQVLVVNEDFATGHDLSDGRLLWQLELPGKTSSNANVSNAVAVPPDRVFVSKGYGIGSALWLIEARPSPEGLPYTATPLWQSQRVMRTKFTNVAVDGEHVYGLSEGVLECIALATGERVWKGGRYGHGHVLLVGGVLVVSTEDGEIVYVEATPQDGPNELARFEAVSGQTWNPHAIAGDLLLVRNSQEAAAFRLPTR